MELFSLVFPIFNYLCVILPGDGSHVEFGHHHSEVPDPEFNDAAQEHTKNE